MTQPRRAAVPPNDACAPPASERRTLAVGDVDPVAAALRLGSAAIGRTLMFVDASSKAHSADGLASWLPERALVKSCDIHDEDGRALGALRAVDLTGEAAFDPSHAQAFDDVATVIGEHLAAEGRVGRIDHITRLPNRSQYERDYAPMVAAARQPCLLLVAIGDAKHFDELLRALGHACSESFLRSASEIVRRAGGRDRRIYHVSVLSFAFLVDRAAEDVAELARELVSAFVEPVICDGLPIATRISVGLAPIGGRRIRAAESLRSALVAAQDSRRAETGYAFYDRKSDEAHLRAFGLLSDLGSALRDYGQLTLVYQPRIDFATGKAAGAEALIRWTHPTLGPISPAEFIPLAETTALIELLTDFVMARTCRQSAAWRKRGLDVKLSVNIAPFSLHAGDFLPRLQRAMAAYAVDPCAIELEFTEGTLTSSDAGVRATIDAIRNLGVTVAIDDFGTGYSNLDYLTRVPADVMKIDRSFMREIDVDQRRGRLVRTMIGLAHDLGFKVVAEGVETKAVYDLLASWDCDEGQGYFMSHPLGPDDFEAFVKAQ